MKSLYGTGRNAEFFFNSDKTRIFYEIMPDKCVVSGCNNRPNKGKGHFLSSNFFLRDWWHGEAQRKKGVSGFHTIADDRKESCFHIIANHRRADCWIHFSQRKGQNYTRVVLAGKIAESNIADVEEELLLQTNNFRSCYVRACLVGNMFLSFTLY